MPIMIRTINFLCAHCEMQFPRELQCVMHERQAHSVAVDSQLDQVAELIPATMPMAEPAPTPSPAVKQMKKKPIGRPPKQKAGPKSVKKAAAAAVVKYAAPTPDVTDTPTEDEKVDDPDYDPSTEMDTMSEPEIDADPSIIVPSVDNEPGFPCDECGKRFLSQAILQRHMGYHDKERPFKCPQLNCNESFVLKGGLVDHLVGVHTVDAKKATDKAVEISNYILMTSMLK